MTAFGARAGAGRDLDVLVLGDVNPDLVLADSELEVAFGQAERLVEDAALTIGGSGGIMACAAARLGLRTAIAGMAGEDLFGRFMLQALGARGVDTSGVIIEASARTGLTVILARSGDRAILTFPGAIPLMSPDRVDRELLARAQHVHVSSYFLQTGLMGGLAALLQAVRNDGATTSLDPNWDPSGGWDSGLRGLLPHLDLLLPNAAEACRLTGREAPEDAAAEVAAAGPAVAVKLGPAGALAVCGDGRVVRAAPPPGIASVDAVGAGDAFDAGLLAGLLGGDSMGRALALGCACGALSTRAAGGVAAQPTLEEARRAMGASG